MTDENDWITKRVDEAKAKSPQVTEAAATRMQELITDNLSVRSQSANELKIIATDLMNNMVPINEQESEQ